MLIHYTALEWTSQIWVKRKCQTLTRHISHLLLLLLNNNTTFTLNLITFKFTMQLIKNNTRPKWPLLIRACSQNEHHHRGPSLRRLLGRLPVKLFVPGGLWDNWFQQELFQLASALPWAPRQCISSCLCKCRLSIPARSTQISPKGWGLDSSAARPPAQWKSGGPPSETRPISGPSKGHKMT